MSLVPAAKMIGLLVNPDNAIAKTEVRELQDKAPALGLHVNLQEARNEREIDAAFETWFRLKVGGVVIGSEALYSSQQQRISALALRYEIPTIHQYRGFVTAGGLREQDPEGSQNLTKLSSQLGVRFRKLFAGHRRPIPRPRPLRSRCCRLSTG